MAPLFCFKSCVRGTQHSSGLSLCLYSRDKALSIYICCIRKVLEYEIEQNQTNFKAIKKIATKKLQNDIVAIHFSSFNTRIEREESLDRYEKEMLPRAVPICYCLACSYFAG